MFFFSHGPITIKVVHDSTASYRAYKEMKTSMDQFFYETSLFFYEMALNFELSLQKKKFDFGKRIKHEYYFEYTSISPCSDCGGQR